MADKQKNKRLQKELQISGHFIERNAGLYMILMILIAGFELVLFIRGLSRRTTVAKYVYQTSYALLFSASVAMIPFLRLAMLKCIRKEVLGLLPNVYAIFILIWSVLISSMDMRGGKYPIVFLTIAVTIGVIIVINPVPYIISVLTGVTSLLIVDKVFSFQCFRSVGDYFNLMVFLAMAFLAAYRQHTLLLQEQEAKEKLRLTAITDQLTGLGNETLYFTEVDSLDRLISQKRNKPFAVAVMDVNNVKATNDAYGHRYGCHLIRTAGKMLPSIFPTSRLYHVGGDEFIALLEGEDYEKLAESMARFKDVLYCREIEYEGKKLRLSVSIGSAQHGRGLRYSDVFQAADDAMYRNKIAMKKELGLPSR